MADIHPVGDLGAQWNSYWAKRRRDEEVSRVRAGLSEAADLIDALDARAVPADRLVSAARQAENMIRRFDHPAPCGEDACGWCWIQEELREALGGVPHRCLPGEVQLMKDGPFDPDELVRWAETYGHPEEWAKRAQSLHAEVERLRQGGDATDG